VANWDEIGELTVSNTWQFFPNNVIADTFRITTTILNQDDWDKWKFKSGAYLRFYYGDSSTSKKYFIRVLDTATIYQLAVPAELRNQGYVIRTPAVIRASRYLPYSPEINFAQWKFKLEALI
jgi:hypothetical protein